MHQAKPILVDGLGKDFDGRPVLRSVSLTVPAGQSTVLIGPSASGKTVLLKCLLGLMAPERGQVRYGEDALTDMDADALDRFRERVGVLFQQNALFDSLTVWENVAFRLLSRREVSRREARRRALKWLADVGLGPEMANLYPVELSGGMQKRVGVARAMIGEPELLILDDPTAGLDPILTNAILSLIERCVAGTGTTVLAVTGDMRAARTRFDNIAMLFDGAIRWAGPRDAAACAEDPFLAQMLSGSSAGPIKMRLTD